MMNVYDEPKVDCHNHVLDPARFPYVADVPYRPAGQEIGTATQLAAVFDAYGVHHALVVGPNSGYATDNRCLLDAMARSEGRYKGVAVVSNEAGMPELERLKDAGILGVTMNATYYGPEYYANAAPLLARLAALDLFIDVQVERDQLVLLAPMLIESGIRIVIDHCARPDPARGVDQPGFRAALELGRAGRASVKLSGYSKFSHEGFPYSDTRPYVDALIDAFTLDRCVWGSDWPFLRAEQHLDYGPLLKIVELHLPDAASRRKLFWDTPRKLFGFGT